MKTILRQGQKNIPQRVSYFNLIISDHLAKVVKTFFTNCTWPGDKNNNHGG
jgi:hypothetical protein